MENMSAVRDPSPDVCIPELAKSLRPPAFQIEQLREHVERLAAEVPVNSHVFSDALTPGSQWTNSNQQEAFLIIIALVIVIVVLIARINELEDKLNDKK
jgi:hypothetical protein